MGDGFAVIDYGFCKSSGSLAMLLVIRRARCSITELRGGDKPKCDGICGMIFAAAIAVASISTPALAALDSNPLLSGNIVNPVLSGNAVVQGHEALPPWSVADRDSGLWAGGGP